METTTKQHLIDLVKTNICENRELAVFLCKSQDIPYWSIFINKDDNGYCKWNDWIKDIYYGVCCTLIIADKLSIWISGLENNDFSFYYKIGKRSNHEIMTYTDSCKAEIMHKIINYLNSYEDFILKSNKK